MVSPYPPARDGIAAYAVQAVARLRAEGHDVEVLSPWPSAAHHHLDLRGPRGPLALARRVRAYDKVIVQFHPDVFFPLPFADRPWTLTCYALAAAVRLARDIEVVVHETDYSRGRQDGSLARAVRFLWQAVPSITVHTGEDRRAFHESFGVPLERVRVVEHGAHFLRRTAVDRAAARAALGIPAREFMFLAIGFIQPHKGFDRAVRAFARLGAGPSGVRLDVVGSVRVEEAAYLEHLDDLRAMVAATPGAHLHPRYVSDEEFDRWLVAADAVVLPYRHIWSSGVMERAALYDRPVIVTRVGGLAAQARETTTVVDSDEETGDDGLVEAMRAAADLPAPARPPWPAAVAADRGSVMAEVRARAARERGAAAGPSTAGRRAGPASLPLRRVAPVVAPPPVSGRPGASLLKRLQRRVTAWQLDPLMAKVNHLREATIETADRLEAELMSGKVSEQ
jgi:glycosyltransferase involved in cell wall biosynthesis